MCFMGIDLFSKFAHVVPLKTKRSASVARALESRILASVPRTSKTILSDNGPEFRGAPFEKMLGGYGINHEFSVPCAICTYGGVERFNQTLRSRLGTVCYEDSRLWDRKLYQIVTQYNRIRHSETRKACVQFFVDDVEINIPKKKFWKAPHNFTPFELGDLVMRKTLYSEKNK